jgi:membrane-associated HD superfamily phosphohydrolase
MGSSVVGPMAYDNNSKTGWGAIFGGTFVFIAIMSTFGLVLSSVIFASAGWTSLGFVIWNAVVAIISLYFAGRAAAHLARISDRNIGMWHGIVTFGMCFVATVLIAGIATLGAAPYSRAAATNAGSATGLLAVLSGGGWALWCAMAIGFAAAAFGGMTGATENPPATRTEAPGEIRRVA